MSGPRFDVWVCRGRVCTSSGAAQVAARFEELRQEPAATERMRVLHGGCYGLCELGPNVVVRRVTDALPDVGVDRLTLTGRDDESVYCGVTPDACEAIAQSHLHDDVPLVLLLRTTREEGTPARSDVAARIRALRARRSGGHDGGR